MDRARELEEQVRRLSVEVDAMRRKLTEIDAAKNSANGSKPSNRRNFLKLGIGATMGALGLAAAKVLPASAANGLALTIGQANVGESPTTLTGDTVGLTGPPTPVLSVASQGSTAPAGGTFGGPLQVFATSGANVDGVDGWAGGTTGFGVYGVSDSGYGVVGESSTGIAVYARRSGRLRQEPLVAAGMPGYNANNFEQVRDANGLMWISVPGLSKWKQVMTTDQGIHPFPNPRRVYDGYVQPQAAGTYGPIDATSQVSTSNWPGGTSGVPAGAQAAFCAVQSYTAGVMTLFPDLTADPGIANWSGTGPAGQLNLLYVFVPLSAAGKFKIHTYFNGQTFIDAWGYLM